MDILLHKKLRKAKKIDADINADAEGDISKWSWETTVSYLDTKIQVQKIESKRQSQNILKLLFEILFAFDFSKARKWSQKVENNVAPSDLMATHLFLCIHDILYAHILYVFTKTCCTCCTCCDKKNISHRSCVAQQNYVSYKKIP